MQQAKLLVTMKDVQRYKVLKDVIEKKLKGVQAAQLLNVTAEHVSRLKTKLIAGGFEALLRQPPSKPPNLKIAGSTIQNILKLRKKYYPDFNIMHFMDKLHEVHKMPYSYETIRQVLIKHHLHQPKKKRIVHRMRRRMPKAGMLIQMDSSQHHWLEHIAEKWWLVAMIDDATNEVPYAKLFPKDTLFANMHVIRRFIELKGVFMSLYVDKASHFKTTRHGGLHVNVPSDQEETQIQRALKELDINIIPANSPQAKGRIEVTFRLFQDRLIKEMRLAGVKTYPQANKYLLDKFLPWYNSRYTHPAESVYMQIPKELNLDLVFCIKKERQVNHDNTVALYGQRIQIAPSDLRSSFARLKVELCLWEDRHIAVLYQGRLIAQAQLSKNNKIVQQEKKVEKLLNKRSYALMLVKPKGASNKPDKEHPWYAFRLKGSTPNRKLKLDILK